MLSRSVIAASVLAAVANAQISTTSATSVAASTTVAQSMPPSATAGFNPANVSSSDAFDWCHAQQNSCPEICGGGASTNQCSETLFTYTCICADGTVPDCTAYTQTLPFFICQATFSQCINAHPNDAMGQQTCINNEQCGTKNATAVLVSASQAAAHSTITSAAASSAPASATAKSASTSASAAATSSSSAAAVATNQQFATGAFAAVLMAAFKLLV